MNKQTILIADDDHDLLFQMQKMIEHIGYQVVSVASQKEAEQYLMQNKPTLCVFDLMMEQKDSGFVLAYHVKKRYPQTPVIIVSSVSSETRMNFSLESDASAQWMPADLFIEKNVRPDQLSREISKLLDKAV